LVSPPPGQGKARLHINRYPPIATGCYAFPAWNYLRLPDV
jgi:hypothetical protein